MFSPDDQYRKKKLISSDNKRFDVNSLMKKKNFIRSKFSSVSKVTLCWNLTTQVRVPASACVLVFFKI